LVEWDRFILQEQRYLVVERINQISRLPYQATIERFLDDLPRSISQSSCRDGAVQLHEEHVVDGREGRAVIGTP
jgi:hypothetical protein